MTETKRNYWIIGLPAIFALVFVGGMWTGLRFSESQSTPILDIKGDNRIEEVLRYIEARYVTEVDRDSLITQMIESLLEQLDPHSGYIPVNRLERINEDLRGDYQGIGLEFVLQKDTPIVTAVIREGPAWKAGIKPGYKIFAVDTTNLIQPEMQSEDIVQLVRGSENTNVTLSLLDYGENPIHYTLTREKIPNSAVKAAYLIAPTIGYIKLSRFSGNTYRDFMRSLEELISFQSMENLIIDLRQNPGGLLEESIKMINQLVPEKDLVILKTEGAHTGKVEYKSSGRAFFRLQEIVILMDEKSASASEILAGTLQDLGRATIIGRPSFGKGLVQEQYHLHDGSAIRLSVSKFFTPSGKAIQKPFKGGEFLERENHEGGIIPDISVAMDSLLEDTETTRWKAISFIKSHEELINRIKDSSEAYFLGELDKESFATINRSAKAEIAHMLYGEQLKIVYLNRFDPDVQAALDWLRLKK